MDKRELSELMREKAESIQAEVFEVTSLTEVFKYTLALTQSRGGKTIAAPGFGELDELRTLCRAAGIQLLEPPLRNHLDAIHTGLTLADGGIADTGTLVINSASEDLRLATMLCDAHVAVLPMAAIYPDMGALTQKLDAILKASASYLAFISGPSRTADIERVLSIGVHGPKELHILLMEEGRHGNPQ